MIPAVRVVLSAGTFVALFATAAVLAPTTVAAQVHADVAPSEAATGATARELTLLVRRLGNPAARPQAQMQICRRGGAAVPALAKALSNGFAEVPYQQRAAAQLAAVDVLQQLGPDAAAALPALLRLVEEPSLRVQRHLLLSCVGDLLPWAVAGNFEMPPAQQTQDRLPTARAEARQQIDLARLQADLPAALRSADPWEQELAIEVAARSDSVRNRPELRERVLDALREVIADRTARRVTVRGKTARGTFAMTTVQQPPRAAAQLALARIDPDDPLAIAGHVLALSRLDPRERIAAAMALGRQGAAAQPAVPALLKALQTPDLAVQREVVTALGMLGPPPPPRCRRCARWSGTPTSSWRRGRGPRCVASGRCRQRRDRGSASCDGRDHGGLTV